MLRSLMFLAVRIKEFKVFFVFVFGLLILGLDSRYQYVVTFYLMIISKYLFFSLKVLKKCLL